MDRPAGRSIREGRPLTDFLRAPAPAVAAPGRCHLVCYPRTDRPAPLPTSAGESEGDDSPISELRSRPARPLLAGSGESTERRAAFSVDAALRGHAPAVPLELLRALGTGASARVRRRAPAGLSCLGRASTAPLPEELRLAQSLQRVGLWMDADREIEEQVQSIHSAPQAMRLGQSLQDLGAFGTAYSLATRWLWASGYVK